MALWTGFVLVLVVVLDLVVLSSSRLRGAIRTVAFQGAVMSALPLLLATEHHQLVHVLALSVGALVVRLALGFPFSSPWWSLLAFLGGMAVFAVVLGAIESTTARLRLVRVPQLLVAASVMGAFALVLILR